MPGWAMFVLGGVVVLVRIDDGTGTTPGAVVRARTSRAP